MAKAEIPFSRNHDQDMDKAGCPHFGTFWMFDMMTSLCINGLNLISMHAMHKVTILWSIKKKIFPLPTKNDGLCRSRIA